ncbi:hypothetical protein F0562_030765 [Nyssa sinensis]|uniref:Uncharacterized protein n=1 Tax=Nyssa sinensis TaxID=561372 RepID=A0A5J5AXN8_9ASTE|nr:hypothetical protein F0562_030765 [Nyssa sinensis]
MMGVVVLEVDAVGVGEDGGAGAADLMGWSDGDAVAGSIGGGVGGGDGGTVGWRWLAVVGGAAVGAVMAPCDLEVRLGLWSTVAMTGGGGDRGLVMAIRWGIMMDDDGGTDGGDGDRGLGFLFFYFFDF